MYANKLQFGGKMVRFFSYGVEWDLFADTKQTP